MSPRTEGTGAPAPAAQVLQIASGYWLSRAVYVAAQLGIADLVKDGARSATDLAAATQTDPGALYRLLRALASVGVFAESGERRFVQTPLSETLLRDGNGSIRGMVLFLGDHLHWSIYEQLLYSVRTGKRAFDHVLGQAPFEYLSQHPEDARVFDEGMTSLSSTSSAAVAEAYDFSSFRTIMDLGGGNGALLAAILGKYPHLRGILFDSDHVIERARQAGVLKPGQCEMVHGDFFRSIPSGAEAYLFKHVIHDWDDEHALKVLQNCRRAIPDLGKLLIAEMIVPPGNDPAFVKLLDLEMLMLPGGLERTEEEFRRLLAAASFRLTRVVPTKAEISVLEAVPI
jgi:hypothetical protein